MTTPAVLVRTEALTERRVAASRWDRESSTFSCAIAPATEAAADGSLRAKVDAALHVEAPARRVVIGEVDVLLDAAGRPASIELYTSPAQWRPVTAGATGAVEAAEVTLEASWDANGIASVEAEVAVEHDAAGGTVTLRFGGEAKRWVAAAEGVLFGVGEAEGLVAVRCARVAIEA
jgi:hypothetical protein